MSVVSNNPGPLNNLSSMTLSDEVQYLSEILMELRQLNFYLKQLPLFLNTGKSIVDEDADFRNSMTSSDINNLSIA